jgi:hypothetical protein
MILTAHQPVYLPWLGLFHKIALSDAFCYFDDVQYLKKDWNNRNKIKTSHGEIWLTVPVLTKGHRKKKIREIEINNSINWQRKHWKSIYLGYKKAPFFSKYSDFFEDVYKKEWLYLTDLNEYMLKYLLKELGISIKYYKASKLNFEGYKSALVLDMCKRLGANLYIFGALGRDYVDVDIFNRNGVNVYFQDYRHPTYSQLGGDFISHLSIIDLLFNIGKERSLEVIMEGNVTKSELERIF